ncbi:MAG TPA: ATP-binding protein [Alphaproteobacteria bacterium]|nr:ATP-binding protein [Alphaproteobacteria bacterium]
MISCFQLATRLIRLREENNGFSEASHELDWCLEGMDAIVRMHFSRGAASGYSFSSYLSDTEYFWGRFAKARNIGMHIEADRDVAMPDEVALRLAVVTHELLSNAFQHAFEDRSSGNVTVSFRRREDLSVELTVRDNGRGFDADSMLNPEARGNLRAGGLRVVRSLAEDIGGNFEVISMPGMGAIGRIAFSPRDRFS